MSASIPVHAASPGVRLTRRGRIVLVALVASLLLVGLWLTAGRGAVAMSGVGDRVRTGGGDGRPGPVVTVARGDTLWAIAARSRPAVDPRITVRQIMDVNGLADPIVQPGQRLLLPAG